MSNSNRTRKGKSIRGRTVGWRALGAAPFFPRAGPSFRFVSRSWPRRAGSRRGQGRSALGRRRRRVIGGRAAAAGVPRNIIDAAILPCRYAFVCSQELHLDLLESTQNAHAELVYVRFVAMAWRYLSMSMFGSSGGDLSDDEQLQAAAIVASMERRKPRWGGSVFGHKIYKRDREGAERLLM